MEKHLGEIVMIANSPKRAQYILRLSQITEGYLVTKESGPQGKKQNSRTWFFKTRMEANRFLEQITKNKTKSQRARVYKIVHSTLGQKVKSNKKG